MTHAFILILLGLTVSTAQLCSTSTDQWITSTPSGQNRSKELSLTNTGPSITITAMSVNGPDSSQFFASLPQNLTIESNRTLSVNIIFSPTSTGVKNATLQINFSTGRTAVIYLRGLSTIGYEGLNEPSLQWIFDTFQIPVSVGDDDPTDNLIHSKSSLRSSLVLGDELPDGQILRKLNPNLPVTLKVLAVFGPMATNPLCVWGWHPEGNLSASVEIFSVPDVGFNAQTLLPIVDGNLPFDPMNHTFAMYSQWDAYGPRKTTSEDRFNTWDPSGLHHVRFYQMRDRAGNPIVGSIILALEEVTVDKDFQDVVVLVNNVQLAISSEYDGDYQLPSDVYCWQIEEEASSPSSSSPSSSSPSSSLSSSTSSLVTSQSSVAFVPTSDPSQDEETSQTRLVTSEAETSSSTSIDSADSSSTRLCQWTSVLLALGLLFNSM